MYHEHMATDTTHTTITKAEAAKARKHGHLDASVRHPGLFLLLELTDRGTAARLVSIEG